MTPRFFRAPADFRRWLAAHRASTPELWVGFYKKESGRAGMTYAEGVDAALCYGWIDGLKKRVDEDSYTHRFSPRRVGSVWSAINTRRMADLERRGLMTDVGRAVFRDRRATRPAVTANSVALAPAYVRAWQANRRAWAYFITQPPGYQKLATRWIMDAKLEDTRRRRLKIVMAVSARGTRMRW